MNDMFSYLPFPGSCGQQQCHNSGRLCICCTLWSLEVVGFGADLLRLL